MPKVANWESRQVRALTFRRQMFAALQFGAEELLWAPKKAIWSQWKVIQAHILIGWSKNIQIFMAGIYRM